MGWFDKLRKTNEVKTESQAGGQSEWDSLKKVQFTGDNQSSQATEIASEREKRLLEGYRQQDKIIRGILQGPRAGLSTKSVELEPGERDEFLTKMANGEIGRDQERDLLEAIRDPLTAVGAENVFGGGFKGNKHRSRILAQMSGVGFNNWQDVDAASLQAFAEKYPLPMDFEEPSKEFLGAIRRGNPESKYLEYAQAMAEFKAQVYGKRQEYWEEMKVLEKEAEELLESTTELVETETRTPETRVDRVRVERLDKREQMKLLKRAKIDGDLWIQQGQSFELTTDLLKKVGLAPEYQIECDGVKIGLSGIFDVRGREAAMAYVQTEKGVNVRSYYRSKSQGLWRLLPDYVAGEGKIGWYGKGYDEESLTLPMELQQALTVVNSDSGVKRIGLNPDFVLAGTAKRYRSKDEYRQAMRMGTLRGAVYEEVAHEPAVKLGEFMTGDRPPESVTIDPKLAPDFGRKTTEWMTKMPLYGEVKVRGFDSRDGKLNYMFCQDKQDRAWIGSIETKAKVTSTGLRSEWVKAKEVMTPLYEYDVQDGGYGDRQDQHGRYVSMWSGYLSKVPVIKEFLAKTNARER